MHFAQIIYHIIRVRDYKDKREKGKELKSARKRPSIRGKALNGAFNPNRFCPLGRVMTALPYFFHSPNDTAPAVRGERITSMPTDIHKADGVRQYYPALNAAYTSKAADKKRASIQDFSSFRVCSFSPLYFLQVFV